MVTLVLIVVVCWAVTSEAYSRRVGRSSLCERERSQWDRDVLQISNDLVRRRVSNYFVVGNRGKHYPLRPNRVDLRPLRRAAALSLHDDVYGDDDDDDSGDASYDYDDPKPSRNFARVE